jgi:Ca2+-dependent lipid-binding protein
MLPEKKRMTKQKTSVKKRTLNPEWNETLMWDVKEIEVLGLWSFAKWCADCQPRY